MKNNIGYKGNTNNTSVIIFLKKLKVENSQRYYFAWENLRGCFCCCWSSFHFCIFISFLIFILLLLFICRCSSFTFAFRHHPSPLPGLSLGFYTHFILSAQSIAEWFATISFSTIPFSSYRERYGFEWVFFTHRRFFTLRSIVDILPAFIKASLGAGSSSSKFSGLQTDPRNTDPVICLFNSQ